MNDLNGLINQGLALHQSGRVVEALKVYERVLPMQRNNDELLFIMGTACCQIGDFEQGLNYLKKSTRVNPKNFHAFGNMGKLNADLGRFNEAVINYNKALQIHPDFPEALLGRGNALLELGRVEDAISNYDELISLVPNFPIAHANKGKAFEALNRYDEALDCYNKAIGLAPDFAEAFSNRGNVFKNLGDLKNALGSYDEAIGLNPKLEGAYSNRAGILEALKKYEEAIADLDRAIDLKPNYAEAQSNKGNVLRKLKRYEEAILCYTKALEIDPHYELASYNMGCAFLEVQDFAKGWAGYEKRFLVKDLGIQNLPNIPIWNGAPLAFDEGALLVRGEQGLGDQLLFGSTLACLKNIAKNICLQLEPRLVALFQRSFPDFKVIGLDQEAPSDVVAQISMGSLPQYFRKEVSAFTGLHRPYLKADPEKVFEFRKQLSSNDRRIVGLSWRSFRREFGKDKSLELKDLESLFKIPECTLVNLQYGDVTDEVNEAERSGLFFNKSVEIDLNQDIDGLASLISACDLVVSCSTTLAHLAGSLGVPLKLMLPSNAGKFWYWSEMQDGVSLWYPSAQLFHQEIDGDWSDIIKKVVNCLKKS